MGFIDEVRISSIAINPEELNPKTLIPDPNLRAAGGKHWVKMREMLLPKGILLR